jgi:hypothetical protein
MIVVELEEGKTLIVASYKTFKCQFLGFVNVHV